VIYAKIRCGPRMKSKYITSLKSECLHLPNKDFRPNRTLCDDGFNMVVSYLKRVRFQASSGYASLWLL
jgi:hypothetical protein